MPKPLVIVESPAKAKTIEGFLGRDNVRVIASYGHIRDLPGSAKAVPDRIKDKEVRRLGVDVNDHFEPVWIVPENKKQYVKAIKDAVKDASELYLATDEDREGEAISWHILQTVKVPKDVPVKRMVFHEITAQAIAQAFEEGRELDEKLVEAYQGRRVLDRLFGYEMSLVTRRRAGGASSAGRVQSVAARLVVERERERMAFRAASYWDLQATFHSGDSDFSAGLVAVDGRRLAVGKDFEATSGQLKASSDVALLDEAAASDLAERVRDVPYRVDSVETKSFTERPRPPFTTSTIQQEAARKLGFSAARTMSIAQKLYENGHITYMRTDSTNLSAQAVTAARSQIRALYGDEYLPAEPRAYKGKVKNAQEAHEAIRPAGDQMRVPDDLAAELHTSDERRLYELVWKRTVACQMADAKVRRVTARLVATATGAAEVVTFQATGRTIEFPGYLRAYVEGADDPDAELDDREALLPPLSEGDDARCTALEPSGHTTQPPARYTEASLVKELEERGIGRPSTYASVIETLLRRDYVWKKGSALVPSWTAFAKQQLLERHFPQLIDYEFTATMEEALDAIARGEGEAEKWLHAFWFGDGTPGLKELVDDDHLATIDPAVVNAVHIGNDAQGREILVRVWNNGASVNREEERAPVPADLCPDELTVAKAEELIKEGSGGPRVLGEDPETGLPVMVLTGRFGPFVQLGEMEEGSKEKPKRASLFTGMTANTMEFDDALRLLSLPRVVGVGADGLEVTAQNGRYGPYLKRGTDSRSLEAEEQLFTVTMEQAEALFAQPKRRGRQAKPPIADLGAHPESGASVRVLDGRFGPYVTDGTINATVPRGVDPASIDLEQAVELLREREARGPATKPKKKGTKKKATKKKATKKKATKRTTKGSAPRTTTRVVKKGTSARAKAAKKSAAKATARAEQAEAHTSPGDAETATASGPADPAGAEAL
ncbi:MAG TPA: type I DNA topoisomerase [Acidimicrobiia bacterium]|nr:type I DNA topoisomerase [Acidimicrobiia bacterium]